MYYFYTDHWVNVGNGREVNRHKPQSGIIVKDVLLWDEKDRHMFRYIELADGRIFRRSTNYHDSSSYGWEKRQEWGK
jgi:hypothetical protein